MVHCEICKITIKHNCHMPKHLLSKKHKDNLEGINNIEGINNKKIIKNKIPEGLKDYIEYMESMKK